MIGMHKMSSCLSKRKWGRSRVVASLYEKIHEIPTCVTINGLVC